MMLVSGHFRRAGRCERSPPNRIVNRESIRGLGQGAISAFRAMAWR